MKTRITLTSAAIAGLFIFGAACGNNEDNNTSGNNGSGNNTDGSPNVNCTDTVCELSGTIESDLTLSAENSPYLLQGGVFVGDKNGVDTPVTLTIEPGVTVFGEEQSLLTVSRGARIEANGTADAPIVFTSAKAEGERAAGD